MDIEYIILIIGSLATIAFLIKLLISILSNKKNEDEVVTFKMVNAESVLAFITGTCWGALIGITQLELPIFLALLGGAFGGFCLMLVAAFLVFLVKQ